MRYMVFLGLVLFSSPSSAMNPDENLNKRTTISLTVDNNQLDEVLRALAVFNNGIPLTLPEPLPAENFTASGANNAHSTIGHENKIKLENLIRKNFTRDAEGFYHPRPQKDPDLESKFSPLVDIFHDDNELKVMLARSLFQKKGDTARVVQLMSQAIMSTYQYTSGSQNSSEERRVNKYMEEYIDILSHIKVIKQRLHSINLFLRDTAQYIKYKKINARNKNALENTIKSSFLDDCNQAMVAFKTEYLNCDFGFDAFFLWLQHALRSVQNGRKILGDLATHLYTQTAEADHPSSLKLAYATYQLFPSKKYNEAIRLYEAVLGTEEDPDNFFQTADHYVLFGASLLYTGNYREALREMEKALALDDSPLIQWNVAFANIMLENFDEAVLQNMKRIKDMSVDDKKKYGINSSVVDCSYEFALEKAGRSDELTQLLLEKQTKALQKALEKRRIHSQRVKTALTLQQEQAQSQATKAPKRTPQEVKTSVTKPSAVPTSLSEEPFRSEQNNREQYIPPQKKEKIKTKGTPDPSMLPAPVAVEKDEVRPPLIYIEDLTPNKRARNIFHKLFQKNEKISLHDMDTLFKALNQDLNSSQGKGSHTKGTLNLQKFGIDMEEKMITLTKDMYLKKYTIKQVRNAFISAGVVPDNPEVVDKLKKEKYWE